MALYLGTNKVQFGSGGSISSEMFQSIIDRSIEGEQTLCLKTIGDYAFTNCVKLTKINLFETKTIGTYAFYNCSTALKEVNAPLVERIKGFSFANGHELEKINMPKLITCDGYAFSNCKKLKTVILPECLSISSTTFGNCTSLEKVLIKGAKGGMNGIQQIPFCGCTSLTALIITSDEVCLKSYAKSLNDTPIANGNGYIYVPKALIEDYKVATNWVAHAEQFRAIEDYPEICGGAE